MTRPANTPFPVSSRNLFALTMVVSLCATTVGDSHRVRAATFRRADFNADASIDVADSVATLLYLFLDGAAPPCVDAADADDDGKVNVTDAIYTLRFLFLGGSSPPPPRSSCGPDPTGDELDCQSYPPCSTGQVIISEFLAVNTHTLRDGEREFSDWIEVTNVGPTEVDLSGYFLTDDRDEKRRWSIPTQAGVLLAPGESVVIFASGRDEFDFVDRDGHLHTNFGLDSDGEYLALVLPDGETVGSEYDYPVQVADVSYGHLADAEISRELVSEGSPARIHVPSAPVAAGWEAVDFDDRNWSLLENGVGYETVPRGVYTGKFETDLEASMLDQHATIHVRIPFALEAPDAVRSLSLAMRFDDGFIAFLNGVEVARANAPEVPQHDSVAATDRDDREAVGAFTRFDLDAQIDRLVAGKNVLAIQAFNESPDAERFLALGVLEARIRGEAQVYFPDPTPGAPNGAGLARRVRDTEFSVDRGFHDGAFEVAITTATPGATIRYTTDGSAPSETNGSTYTTPLPLDSTTILRAAAFRDDLVPTNVDTQTYLFLHGAGGILQQTRPAGYPTSWAGVPADYDMDPEIVEHPTYSQTIESDLKSLPALSIVTNVQHLFGSGGLYQDPQARGLASERPTSVEFFAADGGENWQEDSGIRVHGGAGRRPEHPKHSFRLIFRRTYGAGKLDVDLFRGQAFGQGATDSFDKLILRGGFNNTFPHWYDEQGVRSQYVRDQWARDLQLELGHGSPRGRYVHLFLNGLYWGLYNVVERPDEDFMASYLGGEEEDHDVIKNGGVVAGTGTAWNQLRTLADRPMTLEEYLALGSRVDVQNLIDYLLLNFYYGNTDWDHNNAVWARPNNPPGPFRFYQWDAEFAICLSPGAQPNVWDPILRVDRSRLNNDNAPTGLFQALRRNEEFRVLLADRIHALFFNGGLLTPESVAAAWLRRADEVDRAIVGESARWGDFRRDVYSRREPQSIFPLYTRDEHYLEHQRWILQEYFPQRTDIVLDQFRAAGYYPDLVPPSLSPFGGTITPGTRVELRALRGAIFYTLDGTDPRAPGGEVSPGALDGGAVETSALCRADAPARVLVPANGALGQSWIEPDGFDDSGWIAGFNGVGYERNNGYQDLIRTDVEAQMSGVNASVYVRIPFDLAAVPDDFELLVLRMKYDDGFVAYLNGQRIAGRNDPGEPDWNSEAAQSHPDSRAIVFEDIDVTEHRELLRPGTNLLALHGLNRQATNSDMLLVAELATRTSALTGLELVDSMRVRARILLDGEWSPLIDARFHVERPLAISEVQYHPLAPRDFEEAAGFEDQDLFEFLELANHGGEPIPLAGWRFAEGIRFTFGDVELAPGERAVVVRDRAAFEARYGSDGIRVLGEYEANLANDGESIALVDAAGGAVLQFRYDDGWHPTTDGDGPALELIDLDTQGEALSEPSSWRPSDAPLGSPGR